jgi:hypothetical protein
MEFIVAVIVLAVGLMLERTRMADARVRTDPEGDRDRYRRR